MGSGLKKPREHALLETRVTERQELSSLYLSVLGFPGHITTSGGRSQGSTLFFCTCMADILPADQPYSPSKWISDIVASSSPHWKQTSHKTLSEVSTFICAEFRATYMMTVLGRPVVTAETLGDH